MALNCSSTNVATSRASISRSLPFQSRNPNVSFPLNLSSSLNRSPKPFLRVSADSTPKARFVARRKESVSVRQLGRPLSNARKWLSFVLFLFHCNGVKGCECFAVEYMSLPASQYSVLDAERIERVDENTFRCYVYRFKFFAFEVCPVLLVRVEEQPNGCCIKLLSCKVNFVFSACFFFSFLF